MARHVALRLLDPGALIEVLREVKALYFPKGATVYGAHHAPYQKFFLGITPEGELFLTNTRKTTEAGHIARIHMRPKSGEVVFTSLLLADMLDELRECCEVVGLKFHYIEAPYK